VSEYLTVDEIAAELRLSKMTVYRLVKIGELPALQIGRSFRVKRTDLDEYLREAAVPQADGAS
jgi:excisionase family DNA binding protein